MENNNYYFDDRQQKAVIEYKYSDNYDERNSIYNKYLHKAFNQMVAAILRRYPIHIGRFHTDDLEVKALTHLVEKFELFDEWKPTNLNSLFIYDFEEPKEFYGTITTDGDGNMIGFDFEDIDFEEKMYEVALMQQTIYINANLRVRVAFKNNGNDKSNNYFYIDDCDLKLSIKSLEKYYSDRLPNAKDEYIKSRAKANKRMVAMPIYEERKSFSYCQTIVRNFFKTHSKESYDHKFKNLQLNYTEDIDDDAKFEYLAYFMDKKSDKEVLNSLIQKVITNIDYELKTNEFLLDEDVKVGESLIKIMDEWDSFFDETAKTNKFTKNNFLSAMREITGYKTNIISKHIKRFLKIYSETKAEFVKDGNNIDFID